MIPTKRVINGTTYNPDTSFLVAETKTPPNTGGPPPAEYVCNLYQTRKNQFFLHTLSAAEAQQMPDREWIILEKEDFQPMTAAEARQWISDKNLEAYCDIVDGQPAGTINGVIYLRLPASMRERIEECAEDAGMSVNAWVLRATRPSIPTVSSRPPEDDEEDDEVRVPPDWNDPRFMPRRIRA